MVETGEKLALDYAEIVRVRQCAGPKFNTSAYLARCFNLEPGKFRFYFGLAAITSISTKAQGAARAATCIALRAGLLGWSFVPKNWL